LYVTPPCPPTLIENLQVQRNKINLYLHGFSVLSVVGHQYSNHYIDITYQLLLQNNLHKFGGLELKLHFDIEFNNMENGLNPISAISVIMPAFNECEGLADTVSAVTSQFENISYELLIVDDGSTDETWSVIQRLSKDNPRIRGLKFSRNFGHQPALLAGLSAARGDAVIMMDADGQHPPELIPKMIEKWLAGAVVVQGLRHDGKGIARSKRGSSSLFYRMYSWLAQTPIQQGSADFRLLDRTAVDVIINSPHSALFLRGFVPWTGLKTDFIEFSCAKRTAGATKYSTGKMFGLARQGIMRFSVKPLRLATWAGGLTCLGALAYLVYIIVIRLTTSDFVAGWASVASMLALLGGLQLLIMGILGEYVGMIFELLQGRPSYIIEKKTNPPDSHKQKQS
jgi:polyisoprenyl-phosphate glycosyltransferase